MSNYTDEQAAQDAERMRQIALDGIERKAQWTSVDAKSLSEYVMMLRMQPPFETRAHDEMKRAETVLIEALDIVRACIATYEKLLVKP